MKYSNAIALFLGAVATNAAAPEPDEDGYYTLKSDAITAKFIPYGATLTNLWVKDKNGEAVDIVLGYDDIATYPKDPGHPVYNAIPGRYANRIGNGQFKIGDKVYKTEQNDGSNTLHSGTNNWSFRDFNVTDVTDDSITFSILDKAGSSKGMPGDVSATVTYTIKDNTWGIKMDATTTEVTPLMLTQHTYFNLDAYKDPATDKIWNHTLTMPYSERYLEADQGALPTGKIATAAPGSINDFASEPMIQVGHASGEKGFAGNCGADGACEGYNGYWLIEDAPKDAVVLALASDFSGIKAELKTDQPGVVLYSCNWMSGDQKLKKTQGIKGRDAVTRSSCIAIEAQDYPDGINHPEWGRTDAQFTGPDEKYSWESSWTFGVLGNESEE